MSRKVNNDTVVSRMRSERERELGLTGCLVDRKWRKIRIEEIEELVGLTCCRVDRINCIIIIMDSYFSYGTQVNGENIN